MVSDIFEITFEKAAIGMAHVGADGKWIRVNQQLCHFLGYSREELLKLTFQDITHQDDLDFDLTHTEQLYQGLIDSFSIEKRYIRKDGKLTWAQLSASCVRDSAGQIDYFISVIADINERKKLEIKNNKTRLKLELSNQKYKKLNQNLKKAEHLAKLGNWSFDIVNNKLSWSDEIFNIFEMDSERFEATYEAFLNAIHPEDREMVESAYAHSLKTQEKYQIVHRLLLKNNKIKYVMEQCETKFNQHGTPILSVGTVQDITEIRETQNQLIESEQFHRTIVSSIDKAILILEDNIIIDCNPASISLFEMSEESLIGTNILNSNYNIECSDEPFEYYLKHAYQGKVTSIQCTLISSHNVKSSKVLEITLANYGNEANKLILLARDVTQILEEEKFFKMHTRQAQMGEMISMIAHQWRQPLAIINAIASQLRLKEMLKEDENHDLMDHLVKIEQQSLHLSQTISDYRDFFRPDKPIETIALSDLIQHTLELIDYALKSQGVTIHHRLHKPVFVHIYKNELIQVLISLFKNSFDAFEENGITNRIITVDINQDNSYGVIQITDNAGGISIEVLNKIFVPYFTTKNHAYGTGLGLYMSKMIIEDHCHGLLEVSSSNEETTITIKLPYTSE